MALSLAWPACAPPRSEASLVVGLSGGLDSMALLHLLARGDARPRRLRALHVHHGLQAGADAWATHCLDACVRLDVECRVVHVQVPRDSGEGLEAAARRARHAAFEAALDEDEILALAHHRDDQAETFLLRALRASGVEGLAAMRPWRNCGRGWLWRPLLATPRGVLQDYARAQGLAWIEDPANADEQHDRNFLRHRVLPALRTRWPQAEAAFARAAALQAESATLLEADDAQALAEARVVDPACLQVEALARLEPARLARVLRRWLAEAGLPPLPAEGVARIADVLLDPAPGEHAQFAWHGAVVRRWRGLLWAGRPLPPPVPAGLRLAWDGAGPLDWPGGGTLRMEPAAEPTVQPAPDGPILLPFLVHPRTGGERIVLRGRRHSHALKHVLQALGVPPWLRSALPLLSSPDGELLAAADVALSARLDDWLRASGRRLVWTPPA